MGKVSATDVTSPTFAPVHDADGISRGKEIRTVRRYCMIVKLPDSDDGLPDFGEKGYNQRMRVSDSLKYGGWDGADSTVGIVDF